MSIKIAINGFGRIGRLLYRSLLEQNMFNNKVEVVVVNDLVDAKGLEYLLKYDSTQGNLDFNINALNESTIQVGERTLKTLALKTTPDQLPWKDFGIDIVVESTGLFTKSVAASGHLNSGAKKVIITAPSDPDVKTIVMGVNDNTYNNENIISGTSCTTNCLAPLCYVLLKEGFGIKEGLMTTDHSYTATQQLVDAPRSALREGRAAALNIIPAASGSATSIYVVLPELKGKLTGMAFRVPTPAGSVVDLTFKPEKSTSLNEINAAIKNASETYLKGIMGYTEDPVVSSDFIHDSRSSIYDSTASIELNPEFFKLISWYDNEWGYSCRIADLINKIADSI